MRSPRPAPWRRGGRGRGREGESEQRRSVLRSLRCCVAALCPRRRCVAVRAAPACSAMSSDSDASQRAKLSLQPRSDNAESAGASRAASGKVSCAGTAKNLSLRGRRA